MHTTQQQLMQPLLMKIYCRLHNFLTNFLCDEREMGREVVR